MLHLDLCRAGHAAQVGNVWRCHCSLPAIPFGVWSHVWGRESAVGGFLWSTWLAGETVLAFLIWTPLFALWRTTQSVQGTKTSWFFSPPAEHLQKEGNVSKILIMKDSFYCSCSKAKPQQETTSLSWEPSKQTFGLENRLGELTYSSLSEKLNLSKVLFQAKGRCRRGFYKWQLGN